MDLKDLCDTLEVVVSKKHTVSLTQKSFTAVVLTTLEL